MQKACAVSRVPKSFGVELNVTASHPPVFPGPLRYLRLLSGLSKRDEKPVVSKVTELRSAAARMDDMFSDHAARQHALESASLSSSFSLLNPGCVPL